MPFVARDRYAGLGHHLTPEHLVVRSGSFVRRRDVVQRTGIIGWNVRSSWFQRRVGLAHLTATTAAGKQGYTAFDVPVEGRRCLDAGASTGGFTEVLLDRGAGQVVAADVGYGQLAWPLRSDSRVVVMERTNVRALTADLIGGPVDLVVADLSFISLATVLPALVSCASAGADIVPMVKPQFEVGKARVGPGGVVSDPEIRADAVLSVARRAAELDWHTVDVTSSPLPGPSGNVEFFLRLRAQTDRPLLGESLESAVRRAIEEGPQ
jgi:23S rRNA (cytidine1920-2'-O)/16S rRNA (cytidine1409-2'-O)-methyltransferase